MTLLVETASSCIALALPRLVYGPSYYGALMRNPSLMAIYRDVW